MDKRIRMSQEEMHNYFIREQKVMQYGIEFLEIYVEIPFLQIHVLW